MNIEVGSFIWAFLQIAGLCTVALAIAWGLRGRRPQIVTAMLAGTCLATLALAAVAIVPALQWTFVDDSREVTTVNGSAVSAQAVRKLPDQEAAAVHPTDTPQSSPQSPPLGFEAVPSGSASRNNWDR